MSRVAELIDLIVQGKNAEASDVLNQELLSRSYDAINQAKPEIANDYFATVLSYDGEGNPTYERPEPEEEVTQDETDS